MIANISFLRIALILFLFHFCYSKKINDGSKNAESKDKRGAEPNFFHERHGRNFDAHGRKRQAGGCCTVAPSSCNSTSPYRTADGTCNNLANPCWGSAGIPFIRLIPPQYENTIDSPRGFGRIVPLPKPRNVSASMVNTVNPPTLQSDPITLMVMQWGQFCDHDMTFTPDLGVPDCCSSTNTSCFNIDTTNDPFYSPFNVTCLPFVRSRPTMCPPNNTREQINERTAFLDASMVYGSSNAEMNDLRVNNSFLLKFTKGENGSCTATDPERVCGIFLPTRPNSMTSDTEFFAGDFRVEEQPGLTSIHTIFVRMHNHLSLQMKTLNPSCSNEIIFQETRKLIGALVQHITYNEFLPIVVGQTMMAKYNLHLGNRTAYDSSLNPTTPNVFSTAAFRFGHSLITDRINSLATSLDLFRSFNNHNITLMNNTFPSLLMIGIANQDSEPMDHILAEAVQSRLFSTNANFGEDLYSRNVQRGRDHGLPGYASWANRYANGSITSFSDLNSLMPSAVVTTLNNLYGGRLNDIDLFPAAIAENRLSDSILGRTLANINAERFKTLKLGDRFWYENTGRFTTNQLNRIYNTRLSAIVCFFSNRIQMQELVMQKFNSQSNPSQTCTNLMSGSVVNNVNDWDNLCPTG